MLADIAQGESGVADVFFLIAIILAFLAALVAGARRPEAWLVPTLGWAAVGCVAFGLMLL